MMDAVNSRSDQQPSQPALCLFSVDGRMVKLRDSQQQCFINQQVFGAVGAELVSAEALPLGVGSDLTAAAGLDIEIPIEGEPEWQATHGLAGPAQGSLALQAALVVSLVLCLVLVLAHALLLTDAIVLRSCSRSRCCCWLLPPRPAGASWSRRPFRIGFR